MTKHAGIGKTNAGSNRERQSWRVFTFCELPFYGALILSLAYSVFFPIYITLHAYYHYIIFFFTVLIFVSGRKVRYNWMKAAGLLVFFLICAAAILMNHSGMGVLIQIIWPLCIIYMFKNYPLSERYIDRINILMIGGWLLCIVGSLSYTDSYFDNFEKGIEQVGINPNTIAIIAVTSCMFLGLYIDSKNKSKILKLMVYVISFAALYRSRARTSLVAFFAILLLEIFLKNRLKNSKKIALFIVAIIISAGILFPFIYVGLYASGTVTYDTQFLGKRMFTGRQYIWINLWNYLQENHDAFIWGVGYNTELYSRGTFNLHNAYLMVFAQYGLLVLAIYLAFLFQSVANMYGNIGRISDLQFKCYQILIYVLIVGFGEAIFSYLPNMIFVAMAIGIGCKERLEAG